MRACVGDLLKAKNVLKKIFEENPGIMKDQPVQVVVDALGDSSVVLSARGWTTCEDYWTAKWSITEAIKLTLSYPTAASTCSFVSYPHMMEQTAGLVSA